MLYDDSILCVLYGVEDVLNRTVSFKTFTAVMETCSNILLAVLKGIWPTIMISIGGQLLLSFLIFYNLLFVCMGLWLCVYMHMHVCVCECEHVPACPCAMQLCGADSLSSSCGFQVQFEVQGLGGKCLFTEPLSRPWFLLKASQTSSGTEWNLFLWTHCLMPNLPWLLPMLC